MPIDVLHEPFADGVRSGSQEGASDRLRWALSLAVSFDFCTCAALRDAIGDEDLYDEVRNRLKSWGGRCD